MENKERFDPTEEMKQIRKNIRRRNQKNILISVVLALALVLGIVKIGIPQVEKLYWTPGASSTGTVSDLEMTLNAYTELFLPGWNFVNAHHGHTGFAAYDLNITRCHVGRDELDDQEGTLVKNRLGWGAGFTRDWVSPGLFDRMTDVVGVDEEEQGPILETLEGMPEYITLEVAVSFAEDLDMAEILKIHSENACTIAWVGIRSCSPRASMGLYCGMAPFTNIQVMDAEIEGYPHFYLAPQNTPDPSRQAGVLEQHFKSLLAYSADQLDAGRGAQVFGGDRNYYREVLEYVEEKGIQSYGIVVFGTPQQLRELMKNGKVTQVKIMDAWIDVK